MSCAVQGSTPSHLGGGRPVFWDCCFISMAGVMGTWIRRSLCLQGWGRAEVSPRAPLALKTVLSTRGLRGLGSKASQAGRHCTMRLRAVSSDGNQTGGLDSILEAHGPGRQRTGSQALCLLPPVEMTLGRAFHTVCLEASHWSGVRLSSCVQVAGVCYKQDQEVPHHSVLAPQLFQCPLPSFSLHWDFTF